MGKFQDNFKKTILGKHFKESLQQFLKEILPKAILGDVPFAIPDLMLEKISVLFLWEFFDTLSSFCWNCSAYSHTIEYSVSKVFKKIRNRIC